MICFFHCVDICTKHVKAVVGKSTGTFAPSKAVAPNFTSSHYIAILTRT